MGKPLYIAEKPSVAQQFAAVLGISGRRTDGYIESDAGVVTWCVGHLVTMSYPEAYDSRYRRWSLETLPFLPKNFKYEVIGSVSKQFEIVKRLLLRPDIDPIYICTDSGREGEYIYRLVDQMAGVKEKTRKRVWIDSQTEEEIRRGIREAKDWSAYDNLSAAAYLRAKEDYLMGINFSRLLTLKYGSCISGYLKTDRTVLSVGRVMTCVLGMVVRREREIRNFVKTPFYRVIGRFGEEGLDFDGEWKAVEGSRYFQSPFLYKENGFKERTHAEELIRGLMAGAPLAATLAKMEKKKETKNPPLLYNLAELQNDCSRLFKISPDETLRVAQELYEKKLTTYPRTDARVLSTAVGKEIDRNIRGLLQFAPLQDFAAHILDEGTFRGIAKTRYVNDKQITDHYAIIPTGQGFGALRSLSPLARTVYEVIARRFLSIFYPAAVYQRYSLDLAVGQEHFFASFKMIAERGYLIVAEPSRKDRELTERDSGADDSDTNRRDSENPAFFTMLASLKKGTTIPVKGLTIKEGETSPPKRYSSGSMILAMENAGQLIEDEELRAQIKGSGIGTSATRAEILKKLVNIHYLALNGKTQVITPTLLGELVYDVVDHSIRQLLNPELTASWEKGLTYVAEGTITQDEYMQKLERFVAGRTFGVLKLNNQNELRGIFDAVGQYYQGQKKTSAGTRSEGKRRKNNHEKE
ncbi:MAG: DNA topoisomerase [Clostridiales bacterium]|nr:DNA topoisomerase [Clostridiales bacterium]